MSELRVGGEGGIRTQQYLLDSVTYRVHKARVAANASVAVAPCTLLHARPELGGDGNGALVFA